MDEDNDLVIPEGTTPLPSMPVNLAICPPYHRTKDVVFEGVEPSLVDRYLAQESTFFLVCFLGCNVLLHDRNTGPNVLMSLRREQNDVDTSNMTIAAANPQPVDKRGCMQLPGPGKPPHTLILSNVPPRLERVIESKHVFIYGPGMAFIALSVQDITAPQETFMGMLHAGNTSNAIHHNDPANASLHRMMITTALSRSQTVRDAVVHLFRCKQSEVDGCVVETIDTLTLKPAQASVRTKNVPPTTGYATYMTPPRTAAKDAIAKWIDAVKTIQVEHPKMVLSYHIRHDFKCHICKDISHNDPDCPWLKTDGYLGPQKDTIFGKSSSSSPAGGVVDSLAGQPAEDSRRLNGGGISPQQAAPRASTAVATGNTSLAGTNTLDPRGTQDMDLQVPTTDLSHMNSTAPSATAQGTTQQNDLWDNLPSRIVDMPPLPRLISRHGDAINQNSTQTSWEHRPPQAQTQCIAGVQRKKTTCHSIKHTKMHMRIAALNIRGNGGVNISDPRNKWVHLNQEMCDRRIAILIVGEAHLNDERKESVINMFGKLLHIEHSELQDNPNAKGVAIVLNKRLTNSEKIKCWEIVLGQALQVQIEWHHGKTLMILGIYAPNENAATNARFWKKIQDFYNRNPQVPCPDVMGGDTNIVEDPIDQLPARADSEEAVLALDELKTTLMLQDGWRQINPSE
ncbi:hypothetical protein IW261DRAFT_1578140 [Armillaria novae-zelandiae]|uniref:Uncharacterized protein n=1 Tax=Armillaria novae-zelandiae TaxID=153914 RepID=A0AA39KEX3_9AGAR|nr:hypothetical protein IW261DRAFT_1578140 [Armillaria novae-zelandiae]